MPLSLLLRAGHSGNQTDGTTVPSTRKRGAGERGATASGPGKEGRDTAKDAEGGEKAKVNGLRREQETRLKKVGMVAGKKALTGEAKIPSVVARGLLESWLQTCWVNGWMGRTTMLSCSLAPSVPGH